MKIATFGSCLSRYTANAMLRMFPVELVSCVFHNRSDAFLNNFVRGAYQLPDYNEVAKRLSVDIVHRGNVLQSVLNQYPETIGLHNLPEGIPFMRALQEETLDLIILDNYMDITPVLKIPEWDTETSLFLNTANVRNADAIFVPGGQQLTINTMIRNWREMLNLMRKMQPTATIVFINFPANLYENPRRLARTQAFENRFHPRFLPECLVIPAQFIIPRYMDGTPRHYKQPQYTFYVGMIMQYMAQTGKTIPMFTEADELPLHSQIKQKLTLKDKLGSLFKASGSL
jgi:hypothetical protein